MVRPDSAAAVGVWGWVRLFEQIFGAAPTPALGAHDPVSPGNRQGERSSPAAGPVRRMRQLRKPTIGSIRSGSWLSPGRAACSTVIVIRDIVAVGVVPRGTLDQGPPWLGTSLLRPQRAMPQLKGTDAVRVAVRSRERRVNRVGTESYARVARVTVISPQIRPFAPKRPHEPYRT